MFAQFRAQYPQGSIKTEMLPHKVDGMHVFRVAIADGEHILSTATAADSDLEVAEDRAVKRALILAGISLEPSYAPTGIKATLMPQALPEALNPAPIPRLASGNSSGNLNNSNSEAFNSDSLQDASRCYESVKSNFAEPPGIPEPLADQLDFTQVRSEYQPSPMPVAAPTISAPQDYSDPIAQTDVEMTRLGWTRDQGREYISQVFKKKSRQQLSDIEIQQFLTYLKAQPSAHLPF